MNGISQPTMQRTMLRVVMAINRNLKEEYLRMPTEAQLQANAAANVEKYGLPNFGYVPGPSPPPQTISALAAFKLYSVTIKTLVHSLPCAELDLGLLNNPNKTAANPFIQLSP